MIRRVWNFVKRHRKKLLFTAACAGGAYYAWKIWLPRVQQQLLEKLLKESLELAKQDEEEKQREQDKKANFAHKQQVADAYVRKALAPLQDGDKEALAPLQDRHKDLFNLEECFEKVKSAPTKEARLECFLELQIESISRMVSALYTLHALLMLHRVEFNIVGRELASEPGGETADAEEAADSAEYAAFLETTRFLSEQGLRQVAAAARSAVRRCLKASGLQPQATVSAETLEKLLSDICNEVHTELLTGPQIVAVFLPESVDAEVPEEHRSKVKALSDEARDYLESPHFAEVFKTISLNAAKRLAGSNGGLLPDAGQPCPLAKLNGQFIEISKSLLEEGNGSPHSGGALVEHFAEEPVVEQFCQSVYFQDAAAAARK